MKKSLMVISLIVLLCFTFGCQKQVERIIEDGVEVVLNRIEPYKLKGEPSNLILEKVISIDTERDDIAEIGLTDIWGFDVASAGDIFIFKPPLQEGNFIFKFNKSGELIKAFGNKGQGPGEVQYPFCQKINFRDEIYVVCVATNKYLIYDKNGDLISEAKLEPSLITTTLFLALNNGNYLYRKFGPDTSRVASDHILSLIDSNFEEIKEFGRVNVVYPMLAPQFEQPNPIFTFSLSKNHIFIGLEDRGYEIHVYDFEGQLLRKIRKEYIPVPFTEERKEEIMKRFETFPFKDKIVTPKINPPFKHLFADDIGRLYVVTFEPGVKPGEYMTDVFNNEGVFYSRLSLNIHVNAEISTSDRPWDDSVTVKNDMLYYIQEKERGFKELVVYKMTWE